MDLLSECVKEYPLVGHHPTIGSCLLPAILPRTKPCPVAGRTQTCPKVPSITTQTPALPVVPVDHGISRAHWGLTAPRAGCGVMGFPVLARAGTDPAGFHAEGTGWCYAIPCQAVLPAGQGRGGELALPMVSQAVGAGTAGARGSLNVLHGPAALPRPLHCEGSAQGSDPSAASARPKGVIF